MKKFEVDRNLAGLDRAGNYTTDPAEWIEGKATVHNIIVMERDEETGENDIIVNLVIPVQYKLIAEMIETTLAAGIGFGLLRPE